MHPRLATTFVFVAALLASAPSFADARGDAKSQVEFGINVAQRGLWREAIYRWEKAAQLDPSYAAAYNDLAIAYEHEGQLDKARKAYGRPARATTTRAWRSHGGARGFRCRAGLGERILRIGAPGSLVGN